MSRIATSGGLALDTRRTDNVRSVGSHSQQPVLTKPWLRVCLALNNQNTSHILWDLIEEHALAGDDRSNILVVGFLAQ